MREIFCYIFSKKLRALVCTYYGGLLIALADNLAAHALGGFKESYSFSLRTCRTCMITTEQAQSAFTENDCQLRLEHDRPLQQKRRTWRGERDVLKDDGTVRICGDYKQKCIHCTYGRLVTYMNRACSFDANKGESACSSRQFAAC